MNKSILFFLAKVIDLTTTDLIIKNGGVETNPLLSNNRYYLSFFLAYLMSVIILVIDYKWGYLKSVKYVLTFLVATSLIIAFRGVVLLFV